MIAGWLGMALIQFKIHISYIYMINILSDDHIALYSWDFTVIRDFECQYFGVTKRWTSLAARQRQWMRRKNGNERTKIMNQTPSAEPWCHFTKFTALSIQNWHKELLKSLIWYHFLLTIFGSINSIYYFALSMHCDYYYHYWHHTRILWTRRRFTIRFDSHRRNIGTSCSSCDSYLISNYSDS